MFDKFYPRYEKLKRILDGNREDILGQHYVYTDEMKRWSRKGNNFKKEDIILVISDRHIYVLARSTINPLQVYPVNDLSKILIITENASIFALKFGNDPMRASAINIGKT